MRFPGSAGAGLACLAICASMGAGAQPLPPVRPPELTPRPAPSPSRENASPVPAPAKPSPDAAPAASAGPDTPGESACLRWLAGIPANQIRKAAPASEAATGECKVVEPVIVEALAVRGPDGPAQVKLMPAPTVSCEFARAFSGWLDSSLHPLARGAFGQELVALRVGGGHECRRRNRQARTPMSEHATGRALDIFAFQLGGEKQGGVAISVEKTAGMAQVRFLEAVRNSACGAFSTTLGPGSDAAHANHIHIDIQQRRTDSTRFCQ